MRPVATTRVVWASSGATPVAPRPRVRAGRCPATAHVGLARLAVADVERWHARMRRAGVGEQASRNRHSVLRAALSQAWGWAGTNVAAAVRLRQRKRAPRESMTRAEVQAVVAAAQRMEPLAGLALRLAAVAGLRRAELAALPWDDVRGDRLVVDSSVTRHTGEGRAPVLVDAPTKTANRRSVLSTRPRWPRSPPCGRSAPTSRRTCSPSTRARRRRPGSGGGGPGRRPRPASTGGGACTTSGTGRPRWRSARATTSAPSPAASATHRHSDGMPRGRDDCRRRAVLLSARPGLRYATPLREVLSNQLGQGSSA